MNAIDKTRPPERETAELGRQAAGPARRRRQGDRAGQVRRRPAPLRHAGRQGAAQPAPPRADPLDRHLQGRGPGGREGDGHPGRLPRTWPPSSCRPARCMVNYRDIVRNVMAREKALYEGHAGRRGGRDQRLHRQEGAEADRGGLRGPAPRDRPGRGDEARRAPAARGHVHRGRRAQAGQALERRQAGRVRSGRCREGLRRGRREIIERTFETKPIHQAYIEPHACVASVGEDGQAELWCTTPGHYVVRAHCARLLGMDISKLRVTASEIGGGFGGKTVVYLEPTALALSRKAGRPVKLVMTREEVFRASGPTSGFAHATSRSAPPRTARSPPARRS